MYTGSHDTAQRQGSQDIKPDRAGQKRSRRRAGLVAIRRRHPSTLAEDVGGETRRQLIELAAYYRAERRGFAPGGELQDWLEAEGEVAAALGLRQVPPPERL
ncbi:MAG: DUF2934 domain-containing protein [Gammaproteobacteria bacterium]